MTRLPSPLKQALAEPEVDALARNWPAIRDRRLAGRGGTIRIGFAVAGVAAAACAIALLLIDRGGNDGPLTVTGGDPLARVLGARDGSQPLALELSDGSTIRLSPGAQLDLSTNTAERFDVMLRSGRATFEVEPSGRRWSIDGGLLAVEVTDTGFWVDRSARSVEVGVVVGQLRVTSRLLSPRERTLSAGESVRVTAPEVAAAAPSAVPAPVPPAPALAAAPPPPPVAAAVLPRPRAPAATRARVGSTPAPAPATSSPAPATSDEPDAAALWSLVDVARRSGHPSNALQPLRRLIADHPGEAAVASYTLGRTLLAELDRPEQAAVAFGRAIDLGLPRSLAEPAHAYAVEAWGRGGDTAAAARAFETYRERFPDGRHRARIERWAGQR